MHPIHAHARAHTHTHVCIYIGDGSISAKEFAEWKEKIGGGNRKRIGEADVGKSALFADLDQDGDGKVTRAEYEAAFDVFDADKDGYISKDELTAPAEDFSQAFLPVSVPVAQEMIPPPPPRETIIYVDRMLAADEMVAKLQLKMAAKVQLSLCLSLSHTRKQARNHARTHAQTHTHRMHSWSV